MCRISTLILDVYTVCVYIYAYIYMLNIITGLVDGWRTDELK